MIECSTIGLLKDDQIALKFMDEIRVVGTIMWLHDGTGGVRFHHPMHDAIAAHLGFHPTAAPIRIEPTDRFGRAVPPLSSLRRRRSI